MRELVQKLIRERSLSLDEYRGLITANDSDTAMLLKSEAAGTCRQIYGNKIFIRGLIEATNICRNDCLYCGIRHSNCNVERYRLDEADILSCAETGYGLGFRTFVIQGGEDPRFTDDFLVPTIISLKERFPDCAITLSLGERSKESYQRLKAAGADRYLLRHETADKAHYESLHPKDMSFDNRMRCLGELKAAGFQTGCGFMVGSPGQTPDNLAKDLKFIEEFKPQMCGIGPFIPQKDTPFGEESAGSVDLTLRLLSIIRLIRPSILLPATTALGTLDDTGREKAILCGANVIMPNLSPVGVRKKYQLYDNKKSDGDEAAESILSLKERIDRIGYEIVTERGDYKDV